MSTVRLDRIASLYVFYPLRGWRRSGGIPILMYHSISDALATEVHPYFRTETSLTAFRRHMSFLHDNHYSVVSLQEAWQPLDGARPASKPVVLTFDDAYQDFYTNAFPVLQRFRFSATVFLATAFIGNVFRGFKGQECLTWSEVRDLHRHGISFGSHTVTHPKLVALPMSDVMREVRESKVTIEQELGAPVDSFAYPYAFPREEREFCDHLRESLRECGYRQGVCTTIGTASMRDDRFFLPRVPVNSDDDAALFRSKLEGGYDWLRQVQAGVRKLRRSSRVVRPIGSGVETVSR